MGRKPRMEAAGGIYHVAVCGTGWGAIYDDALDRTMQQVAMAETVEMYDLIVMSFVQMTTHWHFLVETPEPNLGAALQRLNGVYAKRYNRRHGRVGHLLNAHPSVTPVRTNSHFMTCGRYLANNPKHAGIVSSADDWEWGSHRALAGLAPMPPFLRPERLLGCFGDDLETAQTRYRAFVAADAGPKTDAELRACLELGGQLHLIGVRSGVGHGVGHRIAG